MITIDTELCIQCGGCVAVCPASLFSMGPEGPRVGDGGGCLGCAHCAAACPARAVRFEGLSVPELYPAAPEDPLERLVAQRRSVRHFRPQCPPKELIEWALDAARFAPTSHNQRAYGWTVLWGAEGTARVAEEILQWARERGQEPGLLARFAQGRNPLTGGAPCILLCHAPEVRSAERDAAIATTTVELLLQSRGLATCWAGYLQRLSAQVDAVASYLALPEGHQVRCALMVGYPDGEEYPNLPWRPRVRTRWLGDA